MVKSELIAKVANKLPALTHRDVELGINQILYSMTSSLCRGGRIEIRGFGTFCLHFHASRNAHNPKTGAKVITIPKYSPHFKPGKDLRERVNASRHIPIKQNDDDDRQ